MDGAVAQLSLLLIMWSYQKVSLTILQKDRSGVYVKILFSALIAGNLLSLSADAADDPAPFGFSWGPVGNVPVPSIARREDNVTQLIYYRDRLPSDELPDTDEIVLEVCKDARAPTNSLDKSAALVARIGY